MPIKTRLKILIPTMIACVLSVCTLITYDELKIDRPWWSIAACFITTIWFMAFQIFIIFDNSRQFDEMIKREVERKYGLYKEVGELQKKLNENGTERSETNY